MVLIRKEGQWVEADLKMFVSESELQALLARDPHLVPGCAGAAVVRELTVPGVGSVDLVAVDDSGTITLIECKLEKNPESRRSWSARSWPTPAGWQGCHSTSSTILFRARAGAGVLDAITAQGGPDFDRDALREVFERALADGNFRLVVAVDSITDELRKIIIYLNAHLTDPASVMALELGYLKQGEVEVLVPQTYGAEVSAAKEAKRPGIRRWSEQEVRDAVASAEDPQRGLAEQLLAHADQHQATIKGGTGAAPSAGFYYLLAGQRRSVVVAVRATHGMRRLGESGLGEQGLPRAADAMIEHLKTHDWFVSKAGSDPSTWTNKYPEIPLSAVLEQADGAASPAQRGERGHRLRARRPPALPNESPTPAPVSASRLPL